MTVDQSQKLSQMVCAELGGYKKAAFILIVFDENELGHHSLITDIPEEYIKRLMVMIAADINNDERVTVRTGDEIAFRLEGRPKTEQN